MNENKDAVIMYTDRNGETYYCPIHSKNSSPDLSDCVDADIVGRYAGNFEVADSR